MEKSLSLPRSTSEVMWVTVGVYGARVTCKGTPSLNLNLVEFRESSPHPIPAIPLKPAPLIWIFFRITQDRILF